MSNQVGKLFSLITILFSIFLLPSISTAEQKNPETHEVPFLLEDEPNELPPKKEEIEPTAEKINSDSEKEPKTDKAESNTLADTGSGKKAKLSKIEVTGSHISRVDLEGPTPLLVLDKEYIEQSGATTAYELLNKLTLNNGTPINENENLGTSPGGSTINLRGLGKGATLILLNGRRVPNYGFPYSGAATFVDLNSIPLAAIDRIEVLKDGASAIYGADALAGVVNVKLKKDYDGTEVTAGYGVSAEGDANETSFSLVTGKSTDSNNFILTFNYFNREGFLLGDRDFSRTANLTVDEPTYGIDYRSIANHPANYFDLAVGPPPVITGVFDPNPYISAIPDSERVGATLAFHQDISVDWSFFTDLTVNRVTNNSQSAPFPIFAGDAAPASGLLVLPPGHVNNIVGNPLALYWRITELGPRKEEVVTDSHRIVAGFKGIINDWDFEAAVNYGRSESTLTWQNYASATAIQNAFNNDQLNPFGVSDPADIDSIRISLQRKAESESIGADAKVIGEVGQTASGPINLAIGIETRREELIDTPDSQITDGDVPGTEGTESNGHRSMISAYTELSLPLSDKAEMQLAARYDDYSDFGNTVNPKIAVKYKPVSNLVLRAAAGTAYKAPALPTMYQSGTSAFQTVTDTTRCAALGFTDCTPFIGTVRLNLAGNPDLEPEESTSYFLGAVIEPTKNFSVGLDYWRYDMENIIGFDAQFIIDNEADFPGSVIRAGGGGGDPGFIVGISDTYRNIAKIETDGIDLDLKYVWKTESGDFSLRSLTSRTLHYKTQQLIVGSLEEQVGQYGNPKIRSMLTLAWAKGDYGLSLTGNYIGKHQDRNFTLGHTIDSYTTWDTQFTYSGWGNSKLTIGIKNLLDEDPPFSNSANHGYDFTLYDPTGRFYYASLNYQF